MDDLDNDVKIRENVHKARRRGRLGTLLPMDHWQKVIQVIITCGSVRLIKPQYDVMSRLCTDIFGNS